MESNVVVDYAYDEMGRVIQQSVPYSVTNLSGYYTDTFEVPFTETAYDVLGRTTTVTNTDGTTLSYSYDDLVTTMTDARGNVVTTTRDIWGRTVQVDAPTGPDVFYQYDAADRLVQVTKGASLTDPNAYGKILRILLSRTARSLPFCRSRMISPGTSSRCQTPTWGTGLMNMTPWGG